MVAYSFLCQIFARKATESGQELGKGADGDHRSWGPKRVFCSIAPGMPILTLLHNSILNLRWQARARGASMAFPFRNF